MLVIKIQKRDIQVLSDNGVVRKKLNSININDTIDMKILNNYLSNASGGDILDLNGIFYCRGGEYWHRKMEKISNADVMSEIN